MQTFMPYPEHSRSASVLDRLRLGKQRVEAYQVLRTITGVSRGWANHPCVAMWRPYPYELILYMRAMIDEWTGRGYVDNVWSTWKALAAECDIELSIWRRPRPWWLGRPDVHASHRSNLLRKDPMHYGQFGWTEGPDLQYVWPGPHPSDTIS